MTINVTPIPKLTSFVIPSVAIGASAAAGSANTAIRSDSTIAGIALVGTTVNDSIVRFDGTAGQVQGYSSLSPTISDAGIISLPSGALKFPATAIASADANTLDDYQSGSFTPAITFGGNASEVTYGSQVGAYTRIGDRCYFTLRIVLTSKGVSSGVVNVTGLPFTVYNNAANYSACPVQFAAVSFADMIMVQLNINDTIAVIWESTNAGVLTQLDNTNYADNSTMHITGQYKTA